MKHISLASIIPDLLKYIRLLCVLSSQPKQWYSTARPNGCKHSISDISTDINQQHYPCGLVIRVPGYISSGSGFDYWGYQIFWVVATLERGPLRPVRITEELHELKK
jgi:hypothetical protein